MNIYDFTLLCHEDMAYWWNGFIAPFLTLVLMSALCLLGSAFIVWFALCILIECRGQLRRGR